MAEHQDQAPGSDQDRSTGRSAGRAGSRSRSTIEFPYVHLEESVTIAAAVQELGGRSCEWSQVAAKTGQSPRGGAFRVKMLSARTFGLLIYKGQHVELTELGVRAIDPESETSARVDAFLNVPLFAQAFEKFRDYPLPPAAAIQHQMELMGVAPKQTDKARQVFVRSARYAGFFELAADRLVKPSIPTRRDSSNNDSDEERPTVGASTSTEPEVLPHHPFVEGLLRELPDPATEWKVERRVMWLRTAANIFNMIYEDGGDLREIQVSVRQQEQSEGGYE